MYFDRIQLLHQRFTATAAQAAPLAARLVLGHAFVQAGTGKIAHFEGAASFFASLGLPLPELNAAFVAGLEVAGGAALVLGLGTRLFAALLSCTMVVALLTAHRGDLLEALTPGAEQGLTAIVPFMYLLLLGWLVGHGAGVVSLDRLAQRVTERLRGLVRPVTASA